MAPVHATTDRKSTRLNSSHLGISYAVFCLKKKGNESRAWARAGAGHWRPGAWRLAAWGGRWPTRRVWASPPPSVSTAPAASLFFFNDTATTEIYTLSLHDALPISVVVADTLAGVNGLRAVRAP